VLIRDYDADLDDESPAGDAEPSADAEVKGG
jgi:hypothetical protein